jgi:CRISPR type IV-associated protein Csf3
MSEPVVYYGDGMHLDGILAWAKYTDLPRKERAEVPPITEPWAWDFDLPLRTWSVASVTAVYIDDRLFVNRPRVRDGHKEGALWGWCASAVHADWLCQDRYAIRKRPELEQMVRYTTSPSVNLGAGQQKATNLLLPARFATELHWYAVGDMTEVERLLTTHVRAVGKITTKGPGSVMHWHVEPWKDDWSVTREGALTRVMPIAYEASGGFAAEASIRAPYHHASRIVPALRPDFSTLGATHAISD